MHLGFIGLGYLGTAIAGRLLDCKHSLSVWNRTSEKAKGMEVEIVETPAMLAAKADIIFMCMFDSDAVRTVLSGEDGLLAGNVEGKTVIDLSTNHFRDVVEFHNLAESAGCTYLESPVLGSVVPASQGALTVLVSGKKSGYEKVKPVLENIGKHLFYMGEASRATKMKLINNLALGSFMATLAEAVAIGEETGINKNEVLDILAVGGGNSKVLDAKRGKLQEEDFSTHFSNALIHKDLHCLQDLAYELKKPLFAGSLLKELYARTYEEGIEQEDFAAIYKIFKKG